VGRGHDGHAEELAGEAPPGDVLSTSATYDTSRASWWESMGIMVAWMADGGPGKNPFKTK
jgi:hypothetical protein